MGQKTVHRAAVETEPSETGSISISSKEQAHQFKRQPIILKNTGKSTRRFAEIAGGTAAECTAICCCMPCGILNLLILAAVRLPACLCLRGSQKRILLRRSKKQAAIAGSGNNESTKIAWSAGDDDMMELPGMQMGLVDGDSWPVRSPAVEVVELEENLWSKFFGTGFWRTPSLREER